MSIWVKTWVCEHVTSSNRSLLSSSVHEYSLRLESIRKARALMLVVVTPIKYPPLDFMHSEITKNGKVEFWVKKRVIILHSEGDTVSEIRQRLRDVGISISLQAIYNLLRKYRQKSMLIDIPRRSKQRKITAEMRAAIEEMYNGNDKLTSTRIKSLLTKGGLICRCQFLQSNVCIEIWGGCVQDLTTANFCSLWVLSVLLYLFIRIITYLR